MSVCSRHQVYDPDCVPCNTEPWELLGVSKEEWDSKVAFAESEGTIHCVHCGFEHYVATTRYQGGHLCPLCGKIHNGVTTA